MKRRSQDGESWDAADGKVAATSEPKFTPPLVLHVTLSDGRHVNVNVLACVELAKAEAINAALCAALEALVDVVDPTTDPRDAEEPLRTAKAALAKARGES